MEQYYLISYTWRVQGNETFNYSNKVISYHPLMWIEKCKVFDKEIYTLLNWSEITVEQYEQYKDVVN